MARGREAETMKARSQSPFRGYDVVGVSARIANERDLSQDHSGEEVGAGAGVCSGARQESFPSQKRNRNDAHPNRSWSCGSRPN